jgi:hypothetical protein
MQLCGEKTVNKVWKVHIESGSGVLVSQKPRVLSLGLCFTLTYNQFVSKDVMNEEHGLLFASIGWNSNIGFHASNFGLNAFWRPFMDMPRKTTLRHFPLQTDIFEATSVDCFRNFFVAYLAVLTEIREIPASEKPNMTFAHGPQTPTYSRFVGFLEIFPSFLQKHNLSCLKDQDSLDPLHGHFMSYTHSMNQKSGPHPSVCDLPLNFTEIEFHLPEHPHRPMDTRIHRH